MHVKSGTYNHFHQMIKRTEGVSSTAVVGRMLMCVRDANRKSEDAEAHLLARQFSGHERDEVDSRTAISRLVTTNFDSFRLFACLCKTTGFCQRRAASCSLAAGAARQQGPVWYTSTAHGTCFTWATSRSSRRRASTATFC